MRLVRLLPDRWQKLIHEALKFGIVGGLNTIVNFAVFNALIFTVFSNGQLKANVAATVVAATSSYFMNRHWTYRDRPKSAMRREYLLFFAFNATGLLIELVVLGGFKYGLGITSVVALNLAKALGVALGTLFRFWSYRTFVFRPVPVATPAAMAPAVAAPALVAPAPRSAWVEPPASEFDELTGPLEAELASPVDDAELAELEAAELRAAGRS